jgi:FixJ family two-component response regulator
MQLAADDHECISADPTLSRLHARRPTSGTPNAKPVVYIVDGDDSIREALSRLTRSAGWEPQTFASAHEFLAYSCADDAPSALILDVSYPNLDGLQLQRQIAADRVDVPVIFITRHGDVPMAVRAMKAGAVEFLVKPLDEEAMLGAIGQAIEQSQAALGMEAETRALRRCYEGLSNREREVMDRIVAGKLNKQVGGELGISEITVKAHRGRVMRKMQARSFADLVKMGGRLRTDAADARNGG